MTRYSINWTSLLKVKILVKMKISKKYTKNCRESRKNRENIFLLYLFSVRIVIILNRESYEKSWTLIIQLVNFYYEMNIILKYWFITEQIFSDVELFCMIFLENLFDERMFSNQWPKCSERIRWYGKTFPVS